MTSEDEILAAESLSPDRARRLAAGSALLVLSAGAVIWWFISGQRLRPYLTFGPAAVGLYLAAIALLLKPGYRLLRIACTIMLFVAVLVPALRSPAQDVGDWPEYYLYETAFINHASPDQRQADELDYQTQASEEGMSDTLGLRFKSPAGRVYPYHFWLSSLVVAPVGLLLKLLGMPWLRAFAVVNGLLVATAFCGILFWSGLRDLSGRAFAAFWIFSPVTWYIGWPSAEVFSASLVAFSIILFTRKQFAWSTLLAAMAATQNPPLLVYVGLLAFIGAARYFLDHRILAAVRVIAATLPAFLPNIFYLVTFGTTNLIIEKGEAGLDFVSMQRLTSFYLDLNQGVAPYAPILLLLWVPAVLLAVRRRTWFVVVLTGTCLAMTVLSAMGGDWCSGSVGIIRWAVWQIPLIVWIIVEVFRPSMPERWGLFALGTGQAAIALLVLIWPAYVPDFLHHGPLARYVLESAPRLYSPEPDIFFDRTMHYEVSDSVLNPSAIPTESVGYRDRFGAIRKVLMPGNLVGPTAQALGLREESVRARMYPAGRAGLYYLDLP